MGSASNAEAAPKSAWGVQGPGRLMVHVVQHRPGELPSAAGDIEASGLFDVVQVRQFDWEIRYTAEEYIALLNTFSGHIAMAEWQREKLFSFIRGRLAERADGRLRRHWGAVLQVARRREVPAGG